MKDMAHCVLSLSSCEGPGHTYIFGRAELQNLSRSAHVPPLVPTRPTPPYGLVQWSLIYPLYCYNLSTLVLVTTVRFRYHSDPISTSSRLRCQSRRIPRLHPRLVESEAAICLNSFLGVPEPTLRYHSDAVPVWSRLPSLAIHTRPTPPSSSSGV